MSTGQFVLPGKKIGNMGHTGTSTEPHLHYEVNTGWEGTYYDICVTSNEMLPNKSKTFKCQTFNHGTRTPSTVIDRTLTLVRSTTKYSNSGAPL